MSEKEKIGSEAEGGSNNEEFTSNSDTILDIVKDTITKEGIPTVNTDTDERSAQDELNVIKDKSADPNIKLNPANTGGKLASVKKLTKSDILLSLIGGVVLSAIFIVSIYLYDQNKVYNKSSGDAPIKITTGNTDVPTNDIELIDIDDSKFYYGVKRPYLMFSSKVKIDYAYLRAVDRSIDTYEYLVRREYNEEEDDEASYNYDDSFEIKENIIVDAGKDSFTMLGVNGLIKLKLIKSSESPEICTDKIVIDGDLPSSITNIGEACTRLEESLRYASGMINGADVDGDFKDMTELNFDRVCNALDTYLFNNHMYTNYKYYPYLCYLETNQNNNELRYNDPIVAVIKYGKNYDDILTVTLGIEDETVSLNVDDTYLTKKLTYRDSAKVIGEEYEDFDEYTDLIRQNISKDVDVLNMNILMIDNGDSYYLIDDYELNGKYFEISKDLSSISLADKDYVEALLNTPLN